MFLRESWYVFGWAYELDQAEGLLGRVVIGEPIVVWRDSAGSLHAMQDRCPHRRAPLSLGRIEGSTLRCMYHGLQFDSGGRCIHVPGMDSPPDIAVRTFPIVEKDGWLWVWTGKLDGADEGLIPDAFGIDDPARPMKSGRIEYEAHYQLIHDNLCDLSHLDYVHETTLGRATGARWSDTAPKVTSQGRAIRFERWFEGAAVPNKPDSRVDVWSCYEFAVPGVFIMQAKRFATGTAAACGGEEPHGLTPINHTLEQQAVTPISEHRTAYHFATGMHRGDDGVTLNLDARMQVIQDAFDEDRTIIEAQQRIWKLPPADEKMAFLPQDRGPMLMRRLLKRLIEAQAAQ